MGTCYECGTQITLQENQTKCDKCGNLIWYICNNCKQGFDTADEKGKKRRECKVCGYFICPNCNSCGENCDKKQWAKKIKEILPEATNEQIQKIINYIENQKSSNTRRSCIRNVPITYAKGRIKSLQAKVDGFKVKNKQDQDAFLMRIGEITNLPTGTNTTVNQSRDEGTYGQEYRDAFNLLVCLGKFKIEWIKIKDTEGKPTGEEYAKYIRNDGESCKFLSKEDLVINECLNPKCKQRYPLDVKVCSKCTYKRGKKKGEPYLTKQRLSDIDLCQMYRGDFKR
jgi:hypothetical protein